LQRLISNLESGAPASKEVSKQRWLLVLLCSRTVEDDINTILAKARFFGYCSTYRPDYLQLLDVVRKISDDFISGKDVQSIIDHHIHSAIGAGRKRVAVIIDREVFGSDEILRQVSEKLNYYQIYDLDFINFSPVDSLMRLLLYGGEFGVLPEKLVTSVRSGYLSGSVITVTKQVLDEHNIPYTINRHVHDAMTCEDVSRERCISIQQVLKCMVGRDANETVYVMLIPGDKMLKIKKLRHMVGGIKIDLIPPEELTVDFGLTVGAISPLQFFGKASFYIDQTVLNESEIDISAGLLNAGIHLKTNDLVNLLKPTICDIISSSK